MMPENKKLKLLILGGSGFLSGTLAARAKAQGHEVWIVTRGNNPIPAEVTALKADRKDKEGFKKVIVDANTKWDGVFDCIGMHPDDAKQDIDVFKNLTKHLVFISSDNVFDPKNMKYPQKEESQYFQTEGYGGNKRLCELEFLNGDTGEMAWTVLRPGHIYGPGSKIGSFPMHARDPQLLEKMLAGETLTLVGGGYLLQQPTFAPDLSDLMLSCLGNEKTHNQIFLSMGPDLIESRKYYKIIADILNVNLTIKEIPVDTYLLEHPEHASFLCNRVYDFSKISSTGVKLPSTPLEEGLRIHVESLLKVK